jgi:hypothetical protein
MRKSVVLSALGLVLCLSLSTYAATYGGGSGTAANPYQIRTAGQMNTIGANPGDWGKCFKLMADIDMSPYTGTQYNIIGNSTSNFTGTFDGNGHVVRNLTYSPTTAIDCLGLFGCTSSATIKNLGLENVTLSAGGIYTGGLVGYQNSGTITNCHSTGSITASSDSYAGGLVGEQSSGTITNCYSTGSVITHSSSYSYTGGLVGEQNSGTITDCYSTGSVITQSSSYSYAGGLVGRGHATLTNCYSTGSVTTSSSDSCVGGLVGMSSGTTTNCYSTGSVTSLSSSDSYAGGLVGYQYNGTLTNSYSAGPVFATGSVYKGGLVGENLGAVTNCFWDTQTSGQSTGIGAGTMTGATGKTIVQMRTLSTFTSAGWDFVTTDGDAADWLMPAAGYPYPAWKGCDTYPTGDLNQDCGVDMTDLAILSANWLKGV